MSSLILPTSETDEFKEKVEKMLNLGEIEIFHNTVLVVKFIRTRVSHSLIAAKETQQEDKYQGKVGYVVKVGESAFQDGNGWNFNGLVVSPGEWVVYRNTDGWDFDYTSKNAFSERLNMRLLEDTHIKGRVTRPDIIW